MRTAIKSGCLVFGLGMFFYIVTGDLRWIYAAISGAAVPVLVHLIWKERVSLKDLLKMKKG